MNLWDFIIICLLKKGFWLVSDNLQSNLGSAATEHSQVFEVHSYPVSKRYYKYWAALTPFTISMQKEIFNFTKKLLFSFLSALFVIVFVQKCYRAHGVWG